MATSSGTFPVGQDPEGLVFDGANVWSLNRVDSTVTKLGTDGTIIGTYQVPQFPQAITFDGSNVWVAAQDGTITELRARDGAPVGTFSVANGATAILFDGSNIVVFSNAVLTRMRAADGTVVDTAGITSRQIFSVAFDGANYWGADDTNKVTKF